MQFANLLIETTDGVATLTINRPESLNALEQPGPWRAGVRALRARSL